MNINDARLQFYGTFLRHSVASAVEAIDESSQECLGCPLTHRAFEGIRTVLLDGLAALQRSSCLLTSELDLKMAAEIRTLAGDCGPELGSFEAAVVAIIHKLIGDFAESLAAIDVDA